MPASFAGHAEHSYCEYRRVHQGVMAWETGNLKLFEKLSFDSCEILFITMSVVAVRN